MNRLTNKHILLGVTGGIAAYKSAELVRRLRDEGAEVRVAMTRAATEFITPLTMQAVSGNRVHLQLLDMEAESAMGHIELARWADVVLIAPASANFIAKLANGNADDLLSTLCLATVAQLAVAPAMNHRMWENGATQNNLSVLKKRGIKLFGPAEGDQACGEVGWGRMLEAHELVTLTEAVFETGLLQDLLVVVTAGPTWEALDPVRGISNRSSGKMGYAIAEASVEAGAQVTLISGPTSLPSPKRVQTIHVKSAEQMLQAVQAHIRNAQIFISAAAVADYRPAQAALHKIKKQPDTLVLELVKTPDILKQIAASNPTLFTVGFAAETADLEKNARAKLEAKGVDLIAANQVGIEGVGFEADDNQLLLIDKMGVTELPLAPKLRLARAFIQQIAKRYYAKNKTQNTRSAHR